MYGAAVSTNAVQAVAETAAPEALAAAAVEVAGAGHISDRDRPSGGDGVSESTTQAVAGASSRDELLQREMAVSRREEAVAIEEARVQRLAASARDLAAGAHNLGVNSGAAMGVPEDASADAPVLDAPALHAHQAPELSAAAAAPAAAPELTSSEPHTRPQPHNLSPLHGARQPPGEEESAMRGAHSPGGRARSSKSEIGSSTSETDSSTSEIGSCRRRRARCTRSGRRWTPSARRCTRARRRSERREGDGRGEEDGYRVLLSVAVGNEIGAALQQVEAERRRREAAEEGMLKARAVSEKLAPALRHTLVELRAVRRVVDATRSAATSEMSAAAKAIAERVAPLEATTRQRAEMLDAQLDELKAINRSLTEQLRLHDASAAEAAEAHSRPLEASLDAAAEAASVASSAMLREMSAGAATEAGGRADPLSPSMAGVSSTAPSHASTTVESGTVRSAAIPHSAAVLASDGAPTSTSPQPRATDRPPASSAAPAAHPSPDLSPGSRWERSRRKLTMVDAVSGGEVLRKAIS